MVIFFSTVHPELSKPRCYEGLIYVTGSEKTAHFAQDFKIELLIICGIFFVVKLKRCGVLAVSVQSFLTAIVS